ncbi:hypothetical protein B0H13DRAFT_2361219 [Mycena leptocephala]|nr:hypothetical protein B0H13DRAFT_2361219 [Mycena leptocephala]
MKEHVGTARGASARPGKGEGERTNLREKTRIDAPSSSGRTTACRDRPASQLSARRTPHVSHPTPVLRSRFLPPAPPGPKSARRIHTARMAPSPAIPKAQAVPDSSALPSATLLLTAHSDTDAAIERRKPDHARAMTPTPGNRLMGEGSDRKPEARASNGGSERSCA